MSICPDFKRVRIFDQPVGLATRPCVARQLFEFIFFQKHAHLERVVAINLLFKTTESSVSHLS